MDFFTYTISGDGVTVEVTVTEVDGGLRFDLAVREGGTIGDLNALFLDLADDGLATGLRVTGDDVTGIAARADGVTRIDNFTNVNGEVVKELGKFDLGVQLGTRGIARDDVRETSFVLSHDSAVLTLDDILGQDTAARLTSVGEEGGSREGSLKLGGVADPVDPPVDPEDPNDPDDDTPPPPPPPPPPDGEDPRDEEEDGTGDEGGPDDPDGEVPPPPPPPDGEEPRGDEADPIDEGGFPDDVPTAPGGDVPPPPPPPEGEEPRGEDEAPTDEAFLFRDDAPAGEVVTEPAPVTQPVATEPDLGAIDDSGSHFVEAPIDESFLF